LTAKTNKQNQFKCLNCAKKQLGLQKLYQARSQGGFKR